MVDISDKVLSARVAIAQGKIFMDKKTIKSIEDKSLPKGDVLTVAKISGIQAAKKTYESIPMCHQINLSFIDVSFIIETDCIKISAIAKTNEATGVEMEALSAVSNAALTIYDMCKSISKKIVIKDMELISKKGGKSDYIKND